MTETLRHCRHRLAGEPLGRKVMRACHGAKLPNDLAWCFGFCPLALAFAVAMARPSSPVRLRIALAIAAAFPACLLESFLLCRDLKVRAFQGMQTPSLFVERDELDHRVIPIDVQPPHLRHLAGDRFLIVR